jgi:hypothetical protein
MREEWGTLDGDWAEKNERVCDPPAVVSLLSEQSEYGYAGRGAYVYFAVYD